MVRLAALCLAVFAACDLGSLPVIDIVSPAPGERFVRDTVGADGARVAPVLVEVEAAGVDRVVLAVGDRVFDGDVAELDRTGAVTVEARGLDSAGAVIASASVELVAADPQLSTCGEWLDLFGITYQRGPERPGVADPITAATPIVGLEYRSLGADALRDELFGDCELILALAEATAIARRRGVVELVDIGVYNYRCIGGGAPPDCPNGISQHAYANAIDVAGYATGGGDVYSVNDDWVIDGDGEKTCAAAVDGERDGFLHEIICAQKAAGIWNIVLTPNYNADHRNHFHVDLTAGSDFIE